MIRTIIVSLAVASFVFPPWASESNACFFKKSRCRHHQVENCQATYPVAYQAAPTVYATAQSHATAMTPQLPSFTEKELSVAAEGFTDSTPRGITTNLTFTCSGTAGQTACGPFVVNNVAAATFAEGGCSAAGGIDGNFVLTFYLTAPPGTPIGNKFYCSKLVRVTYK